MLGFGGFADVFLYEQNMPRRHVAVKVMRADVVTESVRQMFQVEANLMAQLSAHPNILTVYQASISADGRPYLVMELCSAQLAERFRRERIPVAEVLRIAVQIGSAVETAHRQGLLHRDIKPSNILTTAYGHPVLSDFGIAATLSAAWVHDSVGMSIPWSAPEVLLDTTPGAITSEVWSLAATVHSLLAGRSPFEALDGSNNSDELIARITRAKVPAIGRDDVPASLEGLLRRGMSRDPARRQQSAMELVRELQTVELELGFTPTAADVAVEDWTRVTVDDPADRTIVRGVVQEQPGSLVNRRRRRMPSSSTPVAPAAVGGARRPRRRGRLAAGILVGAAIVVVGLGALIAVFAIQNDAADLPRVSGVSADVDGSTVVFSWTDPGLGPTDAYQVRVADGEATVQQSAEFSVVAPEGERICLTVSVARDGRVGPPSAEQCAESAGG